MRFGELTFWEIRERADLGWLAIVPTGCTEQQGPHLPVDFDTWFAEVICLATSIALYLRPQAVQVDHIPEPESKLVDWNDPNLDFARYLRSGVIGDSTHATADLGAKLWDATVEAVALAFRGIAKTGIAT